MLVLRLFWSDAKMHHMRKATVRDLRYRFSVVEDLLGEGEEVQITKRKRIIARLLPVQPSAPPRRPDFLARLKKLYRGKLLKVTAAELLSRSGAAIEHVCGYKFSGVAVRSGRQLSPGGWPDEARQTPPADYPVW